MIVSALGEEMPRQACARSGPVAIAGLAQSDCRTIVIRLAIRTIASRTYVEQVLIPTLSLGGGVIMDNLPRPQAGGRPRGDERAGATLSFLPPYSPDFNPIENASALLKALLRARAERSVSAL